MKRRIAALLMVPVFVLATAAPVFAQGTGGCDIQPGQTERSQSDHASPPQGHPGAIYSDNPQSAGATGFGDRVQECA